MIKISEPKIPYKFTKLFFTIYEIIESSPNTLQRTIYTQEPFINFYKSPNKCPPSRADHRGTRFSRGRSDYTSRRKRERRGNDDCEKALIAVGRASGTRACGLRTDRGPLCQILDIIRFNDPSWMPLFHRRFPRYGAVHHGPRRVSGCCHGGSLSSSLTSAPLSSTSGTTIYTYSTRPRERPPSDVWFRGTTASPGPLWARLRVYTGWFRRICRSTIRETLPETSLNSRRSDNLEI